jgi:2-oxoisovalerate dehydrogenase E1 component
VAHEAVQDFSIGAEIAAIAADEGFWMLDALCVASERPLFHPLTLPA